MQETIQIIIEWKESTVTDWIVYYARVGVYYSGNFVLVGLLITKYIETAKKFIQG